MTQAEIQTLIDEQQSIILDRETRLSQTDYIAVKIAEGSATKKDYADKISQRQQWRSDINGAQNEIDRLQAIEAEEDILPAEK